MDAVNEFRKLLNVDLAKFQFSDFDDIKELNKKSYKMTNAFNGVDNDEEDPQISESQNKTIELDDIPVKSALNDKNVRSFEDLVHRNLEKEHYENYCSSKEAQQQQKKPFLRRGEGLKRFQNASRPQCNTFENVQETRRCIRALNLRDENREKKPEYTRKIITMPCQTSNQTIPKRMIPSKPVFQNVRATSASSNQSMPLRKQTNLFKSNSLKTNSQQSYESVPEMMKKFAMLCQKQNKFKEDRVRRRIPELNSVSETNIEKDPTIRKKNIISKIDQLEQRLLYLLNLKSNLVLSTPFDIYETSSKEDRIDNYELEEEEKEKEDESDIYEEPHAKSTQSKVNKKSEMNASLENLKKEIVSLNDRIATIKIQQQQEQLEKLQQLQSKKIAAEKKVKKKSNEESAGDSNESEGEVLSIPIKTVNGEKDAKTVVYKHKNGSISTVFPTGMKVIQYQNGQIEKLFPDGSKQIIYPDNQHKIIHPDNSEELHLVDGRIYSSFTDGTEKVQYPNGDVEVKTKDYTKRHFANGNIKTVYSNGYQETIYSNGRIRLKDNHGNVLCDKRC